MHSSYFEFDSADQLSWYRVPYLLRDQFYVGSSSLFMFFSMNKRKDSASRQPGIDSFFSKSQRTEGNEGADKAACPRRPMNVASVPSAVCVQPVTVTPVDTNVMLKTLEQKFPESISFLLLLSALLYG